MNFDFFQPYGQLLDEHDLQQIEAAVGAPLPPDYRDFLKQRGGGSLIAATSISFSNMDNDAFVFFGKDGPLQLDPRLGTDLRLGAPGDGYPPHSLIIADDLGGHPYFAVLSEGGMEVRWMGYLTEEEDSLHVASSFSDFLSMIVVTSYDDETPPSPG